MVFVLDCSTRSSSVQWHCWCGCWGGRGVQLESSPTNEKAPQDFRIFLQEKCSLILHTSHKSPDAGSFRHNDTHRHGTCACKYPISEHNQNDCRNDVGMQHFNTSWQFVFCGVLLQCCYFVLLLCLRESLNRGEKMPLKLDLKKKKKKKELHVLQL